jgi:hypothetical protein
MCGKPKAPDAKKIAEEAAAERLKLETEATQKNNSKLAAKNRSRALSSLAARTMDADPSLGVAGGKTTLGQ